MPLARDTKRRNANVTPARHPIVQLVRRRPARCQEQHAAPHLNQNGCGACADSMHSPITCWRKLQNFCIGEILLRHFGLTLARCIHASSLTQGPTNACISGPLCHSKLPLHLCKRHQTDFPARGTPQKHVLRHNTSQRFSAS